MLQAIISETIHWRCLGGEEDERCENLCECSIDEVEYRGGVIVLPRCSACGALTTLKADYTLKELSRDVCAVKDERSVIWSYVLPLRYVRNLRLHWMLYERGKAEYAPVLPMPAQELLARPEVAEVDTDVVHALWFGYLTVKYKKEKLGGITSNYNDPLFLAPVRDTGAPVAEPAHLCKEYRSSRKKRADSARSGSDST